MKANKTTPFYQKLELVIYYFFKVFIGLGFIFSILYQQWSNAFFIALIFLATFIPTLISKKYRFYLPMEFDLAILAFIFFSLFLGEIYGFYFKFWWWDLYLHAEAGFLLGIFGFILIYILNKQKNIHLNLSPSFLSLFSFCFSMTAGIIWEIFEFSIDMIFKTNMLKSGIVDTMWDLIVNTFGALLISTFGYFWLKYKIGDKIIERPISKILTN